MQTEFLEEFLVLADELNFRRAADRLHISHPTLSKHIASLERELGFTLFYRAGSTRLTPAGEKFYLCAQRTLNTLRDGIAACAPAQAACAPVRVQWTGVESMLFESVLLAVKTPFTLVDTDVTLPLLEALTHGRADVVVAHQAKGQADPLRLGAGAVALRQIGIEQLSLVTSRRNPLAAGATLGRDGLRGAEVLVPSGAFFERSIDTVQALIGDDVHLTFIRDATIQTQQDMLYHAIDHQFMFGFRDAIHAMCAKRPDFIAFDEVDGEPLVIKEYLAYRADDPNPNVRAFIEETRTLTGQDGSPT